MPDLPAPSGKRRLNTRPLPVLASAAGALLPIPLLRTACRRPARLVPLSAPHYRWYACPADGAFQHLLLWQGGELLAHWVLPADPAEAGAALLRPGHWLQVLPDLVVPPPTPAAAAHQGTCRVVGTAVAANATILPAPLQTGRLLLRLPASDFPELYILSQLRPGGPTWQLSRLRR